MRVTRREIVAAALTAGAVGTEPSFAQGGDVAQLERLLTFEQRLEDAYRAALARAVIDPALGRILLAHEREHVRGLETALAALGRRRPRATVAPRRQGVALADRRAFASFALSVETEAVAAYAEVLSTLDAPGLLQPLGSIMASGAQHAVALRGALRENLLAHRG